ncbi:hypothetical protein DACRYDRAFT_116333 [Dacryopinax primogenitus]|uniref:F-box domain-containing protein n=1 Tax=Dacryopinax primogenitus (strain DJM 731) TaxID=1858805 RepID=M5G7Q3_DACPD|nr:uncharacterized protein DACRYDRAFT_116333 [Dacryopinax primogenitus]EJU01912.1 hypothetical protein DACRYDRAFT_116333 [Dacryopinax primogenitus]
MSILVPLLIPPLANLTAGLAVGLANASQADKSSFSLTIGSHVYSNAEPFSFPYLPYELREEIILLALDASRSLLPPPLPPGHPFNDPESPFYQHPMNPNHPLYTNPATGERNINGLPTSTWRWLLVSREWWAILRPHLWAHTRLQGRWAYGGFTKLLERPDSKAVPGFVRELRLEEGFTDQAQLYQALRACQKLDTVIYAPEPKINFAFPFGIHLIPDNPGPSSLTITLPLELITNPHTRTHLLHLPRLTTLTLTFSRFTLDMAQFLASLVHLKELSIRMPRLLGAELLNPLIAANTHADNPGQTLSKFELHVLSRMPEGILDPLRSELGYSTLGAVTTVYNGVGEYREVVYAPTREAVLALAQAGEEEREREGEEGQAGAPAEGEGGGEGEGRGRQWERTTNLRLFGGLIGLRMEAKKK